jgi:hypothetical protein
MQVSELDWTLDTYGQTDGYNKNVGRNACLNNAPWNRTNIASVAYLMSATHLI